MSSDPQQPRIDALSTRVDELASREDIRTCLYRINRGIDRIDADLLTSGFFPDAKVRWGTPEAVDFDNWLQAALGMQQKTQRTQHLIGNVLIELDGDRANVESYEIARHLTPLGEETKDLIIASRYIDIFERRQGKWRIVRRDKVVDWVRIMEGTDPLYQRVPLVSQRNASDISYEQFGSKPFHSLI